MEAASLGFAGKCSLLKICKKAPRPPSCVGQAIVQALPCKSQGGCACSQLDHGFQVPSGQAVLAADWITA